MTSGRDDSKGGVVVFFEMVTILRPVFALGDAPWGSINHGNAVVVKIIQLSFSS